MEPDRRPAAEPVEVTPLSQRSRAFHQIVAVSLTVNRVGKGIGSQRDQFALRLCRIKPINLLTNRRDVRSYREYLPNQRLPVMLWRAIDASSAPRHAAALCSISARTWRMWDSMGRIPRAIRLGHAAFWRPDELRAWVAAGCPDRTAWEAETELLPRNEPSFQNSSITSARLACFSVPSSNTRPALENSIPKT